MHRFYIPVNGVNKEIFKINETRNRDDGSCMDLNISFLGNGKYYLLNRNDSFSRLLDTDIYDLYKKANKSSHLTVHCNPERDTNTIKRTIALDGEEDITMVQVTPGIKRDRKFVPIIFRICGDMNDEIYNLKNDGEAVQIDNNYNSESDQLRYMLIISDRDVDFTYNEEHPTNVSQYKLNNFNLTILHSFFNFPSTRHSINLTLTTRREEYDFLRGMDWWEIYNIYTELYMFYAEEYFNKNNIC